MTFHILLRHDDAGGLFKCDIEIKNAPCRANRGLAQTLPLASHCSKRNARKLPRCGAGVRTKSTYCDLSSFGPELFGIGWSDIYLGGPYRPVKDKMYWPGGLKSAPGQLVNAYVEGSMHTFILCNLYKGMIDIFFPNRCGPCQRIAPLYEQLAAKYPRADFLKVDVDKCPVSIKNG